MDSKCKNGINIIKLLRNLRKIQKLVKKAQAQKNGYLAPAGGQNII